MQFNISLRVHPPLAMGHSADISEAVLNTLVPRLWEAQQALTLLSATGWYN